MAFKGSTGGSTTLLKLKKIDKSGWKKNKGHKEQRQRFKREEQLFEMVLLPNGDYKKMTKAEFEKYQKQNG